MAGPILAVKPNGGRDVVRALCLDISTKTGWCILEPHPVVVGPPGQERLSDQRLVNLAAWGLAKNATKAYENGPYPWNFVHAVTEMSGMVGQLYLQHRPEVVIIEETNGGGRAGRFTQKLIEFLHLAVLQELKRLGAQRVEYVSTSDWRKTLGLQLSKEQRKANTKLSKAKRTAEVAGVTVDKKTLGIRGKITPKHLSVAWANQTFGLQLLRKDEDPAEAMTLGVAWLAGAPLSTGGR